MFTRILALLPLALLVSASPLEARNGQCNTGAISCCNQVQTVDQAHDILADFGLIAAAILAGGNVGLTCTPISVIGTGNGCEAQQQPVCCQNNDYNGAVNIGCSPINIGL